MSEIRHFLDLDMLNFSSLRQILGLASKIKDDYKSGKEFRPLLGKYLVCIFEKPSTRTRVSFQIGIQQLGGSAVIISDDQSHMGRKESLADTARVLSRYADGIMMRTDDPRKIYELAKYASVPVINGLTDASHPCQIMADIMTYEEHRGNIKNKKVAWSGDGNNVVNSWIHAAVRFGFSLKIGCPQNHKPNSDIVEWGIKKGGDIEVCASAGEAIENADLVLTDTWISMGDDNVASRREALKPFQVDQSLMDIASPDAIFMHCLPANRGEEVTKDVIDGEQSVVWDEAENRLHVQKGILSWCLET